MIWTGLFMALAVVVPQAAAPSTAPPPVAQAAPSATPAATPETRALICENRPVTGRRINQRRCRTPAQAAAARSGVQGMVADMQTAPASAPEVILNGGPR